MKFSALFLSSLLFVAPAAHAAEEDWFASLYTGEGVELRADARVFTLFAVLNAMGYDAAPLTRQHPLPRYRFHPVRSQVRSKLLSASPEVRSQADAFFDAHPVSVDRYLSYALSTSAPPFESAPKSKEMKDVAGLEALLKNAHSQWKLGELLGEVQSDYRQSLRAYLNVLDAPLASAQKLLKTNEKTAPSLLVVNLLDAENSVRAVSSEKGIVLVVGPSEKPEVEAIVREYARLVIEPAVEKKARQWGGGNTLFREAQSLGATEGSVSEYALALFTHALALKATNAPDSAWDAAGQRGYFGLKDIAKGFEDGRPVETWALEALAKAETRRPAKK